MSADAFYKQLDKILLASLVGGGAALGMRAGTDRVTDELVKIRETLAVVVFKAERLEKVQEHQEQRLSAVESKLKWRR